MKFEVICSVYSDPLECNNVVIEVADSRSTVADAVTLIAEVGNQEPLPKVANSAVRFPKPETEDQEEEEEEDERWARE